MLLRTLVISSAVLSAACSPSRQSAATGASAAADTSRLTLHTDFDRGSLGEMTRVGPDHYRGTTRHWIKADGIGDQYYWFFFRAEGTRGKRVTFELDRLTGIYRGNKHEVYTSYTYPVYSYDRNVWYRIPDVSYDDSAKSFRFTHAFEEDTVWIAYAQPYPWQRAAELIASVRRSPFATVEQVGRSRERRPISLITITDPSTPARRKNVVFVQALQHPGEDAGGFMVEGMIRFLTSNTATAQRARENFVFHIVPVMNPDGLFRGITRYNGAMQDLNSMWSDSVVAEPEVAAVRQWIAERHGEGTCLSAFLDVHNHTQQDPRHMLIVMDDRIRDLLGDAVSGWYIQKSTAFRGSAAEYMARKYGIPATTVELSQSHAGDGKYLDIDDYVRLGERMLVALTQQLARSPAAGCTSEAVSHQ